MLVPLLPLLVFSTSLFSHTLAQTNTTGDTWKGHPVITSLDLSDVPSNTISRYYLLAAESQGLLPYLLPVFVARGTEDSLDSGRRLSLSASIHGDELNGIRVLQRFFSSLNETVAEGGFNGTVIGVPTLNPNGNFLNQRNFFSSSSNGFFTNLNRIMPGSPASGASIADAYASSIWDGLWGNLTNVDVAVDLHTLSTGSNGPLWAYADYQLEGVQRLAELSEPDMIKIDPGEPGSVETTFVQAGVPAITLEIGPAKVWNQTLIGRSEAFLNRLLTDLGMTVGSTNMTVEPDLSQTYRGTNFSDVYATRSGWVETDVGVLQDVEQGEEVGRVYDSWGDLLEILTARVSGRILQVRTDPAVEQGAGVMVICYNATL